MVDFSKRLAKKSVAKPTLPSDIYAQLDRRSGKGPLRPAQTSVLEAWHARFRAQQDVILKLHTGQGKTLVGLLILQSKLNEGKGPALYLCPNNFLVDQTCEQARQFGIAHCTVGKEIPPEFSNGQAILITSVQMLFNGLTKFHLGPKSENVGALVMDDCHACIDSIRSACTILIPRDNEVYNQLLQLFATALESQGLGTFADIKMAKTEALLPVPYWEWERKTSEVAAILAKNAEIKEIRYTWPLIKDILNDCVCVFSGTSLEISPYIPPLDAFGSYYRAQHRVFMSATVTNDAFLVKGLRLAPATIQNPLTYPQEQWSGEKMVLIPSLIDPSLDREVIRDYFSARVPKRNQGVVVLCSSFSATEYWKAKGVPVSNKDTIDADIARLREGDCEVPLAFANRYDGTDLPDDTCRVLVLDGKPYANILVERYAEECRSSSSSTFARIARSIEQGMGRSVRGEKDYSVVILTGPELVSAVRSLRYSQYFSAQTKLQVELGLEISALAKEEVGDATEPLVSLSGLINQCIKRDENWKAFYVERMNGLVPQAPDLSLLAIYEKELEAEILFQARKPNEAIAKLQELLDGKTVTDPTEIGWYLQEMSRYKFRVSFTESNKLQAEAHRHNHYLMKPDSGMVIERIAMVSQKRMENILGWARRFPDIAELQLTLNDILSRLDFGVKADRFELALHELGQALGFACQRPDKEWKEGPDNLWAVSDTEQFLFECKSEVKPDRTDIFKDESGQMNNACAWADRNYSGLARKNMMIVPTNTLSVAAGFNQAVVIMSARELKKLRKNVSAFFGEFANQDLRNLSEVKVQEWIVAHKLTVADWEPEYTRAVRNAGPIKS